MGNCNIKKHLKYALARQILIFRQKIMRHLLLLFSLTLLLGCTNKEEPPIEQQEIVIIGGGLMGSATAWHLSNAGKKVLLLEKQDTIYNSGSSNGEARIARSSNRGDDIWSYLHNLSVREVKVLIDFLNNSTATERYSMSDIYTTTPVSYIGQMRIYDKLYASLIRQKVDYKMAITPARGASMFGVNLPEGILLQREYNQYSGTINPKQLIHYLHQAVLKKGSTIQYNSKVSSLEEKDGKYRIKINDANTGSVQTILADKVISAAGPYTGTLLKGVAPYFDTLINPQRVFTAFFKIQKDHFDTYSGEQKNQLFNAYPVINSKAGTRDGSFFSMIERIDADGLPLIKIGGHFQRSAIKDLDKIWTLPLEPKEIEWSKQNTLDYFELLNLPISDATLQLVDGYSCVYSLTSTEVPYITNIPLENKKRNPNFIVLGGLSGVGGKGAMSYGLIASNLLLNRSESDTMYQVVQKRLGFERLLKDIGY